MNNGSTRRFTGLPKNPAPGDLCVEAVEKMNLAQYRRVGRKYDFLGCSVCDDLMLGKGQETLKNHS
jgi:hypothetical protein